MQRAYRDADLNILANRQVAAIALRAVRVSALEFLDDAKFAPLFSSTADAAVNCFQPADLVISYLHDPEQIFERNIRRCGVESFQSGPSTLAGSSAAVEQLAQPLRVLQIPISDFAPRLTLDSGARKKAQHRLSMQPDIAIHPGSGSRQKNWQIENWAELTLALLDRGKRIVIVGGEADAREIVWMRNHIPSDRVSFAIDWPLSDLAALLADCLFIGHDSGISHLAAATGARCLLLFGPTDPTIWAPQNRNALVLTAPDSDLNQLPFETVREAVDQELIRIGIRT